MVYLHSLTVEREKRIIDYSYIIVLADFFNGSCNFSFSSSSLALALAEIGDNSPEDKCDNSGC